MAEAYKFYNEWFQPADDGGADLGTSDFRWNDLFLKGIITVSGSANVLVLKVLEKTNFIFNNDELVSHNDDAVLSV